MQIQLSIYFIDGNGATRSKIGVVDAAYPSEHFGEGRLFNSLLAELRVSAGKQAEPRHNAAARRWLDFPNVPTGFGEFWDIHNSQELWREIANLMMGSELDLILAAAFKSLEPATEPPSEDDAAINDLYYIHDRKMSLFNQAVYGLIKIQDLVNRLLHEGLGGDLVDTSVPDWEKSELTRKRSLGV